MDIETKDGIVERPMWQKPEIVTEKIETEFVVLGHCGIDLEECQTSPSTG